MRFSALTPVKSDEKSPQPRGQIFPLPSVWWRVSGLNRLNRRQRTGTAFLGLVFSVKCGYAPLAKSEVTHLPRLSLPSLHLGLSLLLLPLGACALGPDATVFEVVTAQPPAATAATPVAGATDGVPLALAEPAGGVTDPGVALLKSVDGGIGAGGTAPAAAGTASTSGAAAPVTLSEGASFEATIAYLKALGLAQTAQKPAATTATAAQMRALAASERAAALASIEASGSTGR